MRATCPLCGNTRESIFAGPGLVCRNHPGHPLWAREGSEDESSPNPDQGR